MLLDPAMRRNAQKVWRDLRHRVLDVPWMEVSAQDRFLFSYPRSGNTWLRHIVRHLTHGSELESHDELERALPTIDTLDFQEKLAQMPNGLRFFKSHLPHSPYFLDGKVVYIVRDGRDVLISRYDLYKKVKNYSGSLDDYLTKMIKGRVRYGSWLGNAGSWVAQKDHPNLLLMRFEDMQSDPFTHARIVADFTGIDADDTAIQEALSASSVDKVHSTMRSWSYAKGTSFQGGATRGSTQNWRERLTPEQNRRFVDHAGDLLEQLGYPLD